MNLLTMSDNTIVGIGILIIGATLSIVFFATHFILKNRRNVKMSDFSKRNQGPGNVMDFLKRNFLFFVGCFGLVLAVAGMMMLINGYS